MAYQMGARQGTQHIDHAVPPAPRFPGAFIRCWRASRRKNYGPVRQTAFLTNVSAITDQRCLQMTKTRDCSQAVQESDVGGCKRKSEGI
jgi:hypothetical protein